ncbi:MAG: CPBP family intramembrane glutamic endopeptidase [Chitinophagales bacterium]
MSRSPLIRQAWLRVLLFCAFFFMVILTIAALVAYIIVFLNKDEIQKGKNLDIKAMMMGDYLWLNSLIALITSFLTVLLFRNIVDRKTVVSLGFQLNRFFRGSWAGLFLAPAILGTGTLILYFSGHLQWTDINFSATDLFIDLGIMFMVALSEEIVFRGYILNNLLESFNRWIALAISAILFTAVHMTNPNYDFIAMMNIFLAGILLGLNYLYTRNLWFAIFFHFSWNLFQGPLLGYSVSGIHLPALLQTELSGDHLLTGGEFGFEGSVIDMALSLIAILVLNMIYTAKYKPASDRQLIPKPFSDILIR